MRPKAPRGAVCEHRCVLAMDFSEKGGPKPALSEMRFGGRLEDQFQRKLHLARGAEVSGREARALNLAKRTTSSGKNWIAKVSMV